MARGHGRGQGNKGRKSGRAKGTVGGGGKGTGTGTGTGSPGSGSPGSGAPGSGSPTSSPTATGGGWRTSGDSLFGGKAPKGPLGINFSYSPGKGGSGSYTQTFANVKDHKKWTAIGAYDAKKAANLNWNFESYQRQQAQDAAKRAAQSAKVQGQKDEAQKKVKQTLTSVADVVSNLKKGIKPLTTRERMIQKNVNLGIDVSTLAAKNESFQAARKAGDLSKHYNNPKWSDHYKSAADRAKDMAKERISAETAKAPAQTTTEGILSKIKGLLSPLSIPYNTESESEGTLGSSAYSLGSTPTPPKLGIDAATPGSTEAALSKIKSFFTDAHTTSGEIISGERKGLLAGGLEGTNFNALTAPFAFAQGVLKTVPQVTQHVPGLRDISKSYLTNIAQVGDSRGLQAAQALGNIRGQIGLGSAAIKGISKIPGISSVPGASWYNRGRAVGESQASLFGKGGLIGKDLAAVQRTQGIGKGAWNPFRWTYTMAADKGGLLSGPTGLTRQAVERGLIPGAALGILGNENLQGALADARETAIDKGGDFIANTAEGIKQQLGNLENKAYESLKGKVGDFVSEQGLKLLANMSEDDLKFYVNKMGNRDNYVPNTYQSEVQGLTGREYNPEPWAIALGQKFLDVTEKFRKDKIAETKGLQRLGAQILNINLEREIKRGAFPEALKTIQFAQKHAGETGNLPTASGAFGGLGERIGNFLNNRGFVRSPVNEALTTKSAVAATNTVNENIARRYSNNIRSGAGYSGSRSRGSSQSSGLNIPQPTRSPEAIQQQIFNDQPLRDLYKYDEAVQKDYQAELGRIEADRGSFEEELAKIEADRKLYDEEFIKIKQDKETYDTQLSELESIKKQFQTSINQIMRDTATLGNEYLHESTNPYVKQLIPTRDEYVKQYDDIVGHKSWLDEYYADTEKQKSDLDNYFKTITTGQQNLGDYFKELSTTKSTYDKQLKASTIDFQQQMFAAQRPRISGVRATPQPFFSPRQAFGRVSRRKTKKAPDYLTIGSIAGEGLFPLNI